MYNLNGKVFYYLKKLRIILLYCKKIQACKVCKQIAFGEQQKKDGRLFFHEMFHCPPTTMTQVSWRNVFYRCDVGGKGFNNILK